MRGWLVNLPDLNADNVVVKLILRSFLGAMVGQVLLPCRSLIGFCWCCIVTISVYVACACLGCWCVRCLYCSWSSYVVDIQSYATCWCLILMHLDLLELVVDVCCVCASKGVQAGSVVSMLDRTQCCILQPSLLDLSYLAELPDLISVKWAMQHLPM